MATKKMGRPRRKFDLEKVTVMASIGASPYEMASYFDCSTRVIQQRMAEDEEFEEEEPDPDADLFPGQTKPAHQEL